MLESCFVEDSMKNVKIPQNGLKKSRENILLICLAKFVEPLSIGITLVGVIDCVLPHN